jgi:hydrogenase maturation protein HypF
MKLEGRRIEIQGTVQGVGLRPWIYRLARDEGIGGRVSNQAEGVVVEVFGSAGALDRFLRRLSDAPPPAARIRSLEWKAIPARQTRRFVIGPTPASGERPQVSIPADLAICASCLREIFDPGDRRYRYPFTNCTDCGPRFTITRAMPYDRPNTTMAPFVMCAACQREYDDPGDRRFHAQPNACPDCGPHLRALARGGVAFDNVDPLRVAARALEEDLVVAVKGLGGYHLACNAASAAAVRRLRARKHRDEKPFAVMVRDLAAAERLATLGDIERDLLTSVERPIVLVRRRRQPRRRPRGDGLIAAQVAPGNPLVGLMLPYTPLHHLLLAEVEFPLVMTSGNRSDEPIAYRDDEAEQRLTDLADVFLVHDREIESRCDDSVVRVLGGAPMVLRRARGYVPRSVALSRPLETPLLGCGGELKNAFCIGVDDRVVLGPHIGDLDNLAALDAYQEAIERMQRFLDVRPEVLAHDLHPGYATTAYAVARAKENTIAVQHHHAHVVSAMAEHHLDGPVIGVAYDGTGFGTDGTMWGGEIMLVRPASYERLATFRAIPLPGGDQAVHQVWRQALGLMIDALGDQAPLDALGLFSAVDERELDNVRRMIARGVRTPRARGVGRYFDAVGALVLGRSEALFEGQVAMALNFAADKGENATYHFDLARDLAVPEIDLRAAVRAIVRDLRHGVSAAAIAGRFHNTIAAATRAALADARRRVGRLPIVLTGGCFQNDLLVRQLLAELVAEEVILPRQVPPGDGGIALGQVLVADAIRRDGTADAHGEAACA